MATLDEYRTALADAITGTGTVTCLPYPEDTVAPPIGWVDGINLDFTGSFGAGTFCLPGSATAVIQFVTQRFDLPGSTKTLESWIAPVVEALNSLPSVIVQAATPNSQSVGGQDLPGLSVTVTFPV